MGIVVYLMLILRIITLRTWQYTSGYQHIATTDKHVITHHSCSKQEKEVEEEKQKHSLVGTHSHGSEGGCTQEHAWELVDFSCCAMKGGKNTSSGMNAV